MKYSIRIPILMFVLSLLSACAGGMPQLFWSVDDESTGTANGGSRSAASASRPPLDVPPELRDAQVPEPEQVATGGKPELSAEEKKLVAGTAVALDARIYSNTAGELFSAVIDAMTALNMPVQSVDSPSGTVTTDWIRQGTKGNPFVLNGIFGGGNSLGLRYRFVTRVLRQQTDTGEEMTRLEIRTIAQSFENNQWVNRPMKRKVADELFAATEERLSRK